MRQLADFVVGEHYTNDQVRIALRVENLGGIRPALDDAGMLRHVAILTASRNAGHSLAENPYRDRVENDVLIYTASGRSGDQLLAGRNKRILEQYECPVPLFGFLGHGQQMYEFLGMLELLRHYADYQIDKHKNLRKVWIFEFRIHRHPEVVPVSEARNIMSSLLHISERAKNAYEAERQVLLPSPESTPPIDLVMAEEVRSRLLDVRPFHFEHLIKAVMERKGFVSVEVTKASGDGGIDLNAYVSDTDDFFSGTFVQVQAKRWRHAVGSVEINNFRGALSGRAKGIFVTTGSYTRAAAENACQSSRPCITLIDGIRFSSMLLRSGLILPCPV